MIKKDFDLHLKNAALDCRFRVDGNYVVFDKDSDLSFVVVPGYTLGDLLTKNPVVSYTKLNKDLLLLLYAADTIYFEENKEHLVVSSSYRSPEYNLTVFGATVKENSLGNGLDLRCSEPVDLACILSGLLKNGDVNLFNWGCSISVKSGGGFSILDRTTDDDIMNKCFDFLASDSSRNYAILGSVAVVVLFFIYRIFK